MCNAYLWERWSIKSFSLLTTILTVVVICSAMAESGPPITEKTNRPPIDVQANINYVPHQLVVRMASTTAAGSLSLSDEVLSVQASLGHAPVYLLTLDADVNESEMADNLSQWGSVLWAQPNYVMNSLHPIQGSYPFPDQNLVGSFEDQYSSSMLNLPSAHNTANGAGVTVAVIDAGICFANPALGSMAVSGFDFVDDDSDASDVAGGIASGHGTFVAGIVHLTAPSAQIRAYRVIDPNGSGDGFTLAQAIEAAVDDGCAVINLSIALSSRHLAVRDAIDYAASQGVTIVAGAGNDGVNRLVYPAAEDNAMAVAAVDSAFAATSFTNFGNHIDVCAPGDRVYSTYLNPDFAWWSGTSFSSAFTSGLAALVKEKNPSAYGFQIRSMIEAGATNLDSLNPLRSGGLGAGLINPVASLTGGLGSDTALVFPSIMQFSYYECSQNPVGLQQTGNLVSTNAPAAYTAVIVPSGGVTFVSLDAMSGFTGDSIRVTVNPAGLAPGVYRNGVEFTVEGIEGNVWLPIQLNVLACNDSTGGVQVSPSVLWFNAATGAETVYLGSATLTSSNAPALFTAEIESVPWTFIKLIDSVGVTNDSVRFEVHSAWLFSSGSYTNTINYYVDGISTPASLVVHLTVSDSVDPGDDAWVSPTVQSFYSSSDSAVSLWGSITVGAAGDSKSFNVFVLDDPDFLELTDSTGMTNDSAIFFVNVTPTLMPGVYVDTLIAYITGAPNSPLISVVELWIDSTHSSGGDTAAVWQAYQYYEAHNGVPTVSSGAFTVYATGSPHPFTVDYLDTPDFTVLRDFSGMTTGSVAFDIVPNSSFPGVYVDTLMITVVGATNSPLFVINQLIADSVSSDTSTATAAVDPNLIIVDAVVGGPTIIRQALVTSTNAPTWYTAYVMPEWHNFVTLSDTLGQTNDSITVMIPLSGLGPDIYIDTVMIQVNGVGAPVKLAVELRLSAPKAMLKLWNYPNPFNPSTEIGFIVPTSAHVRLDVFNTLGQRVETLVDQMLIAGEHSVNWDGRDVPSGVYFYRLTAGGHSETKKMLLIK